MSYQRPQPPATEKLSGFAILGLCLSIVSFLVPMLALLGIFFSGLALYQMRSEPRRGKMVALGGLCVGVMVFAVFIGALVLGW